MSDTAREWCDECGYPVGPGGRLSYEVDDDVLCSECYGGDPPFEPTAIPTDVAASADNYWNDVLQYLEENDHVPEGHAVTAMSVEVEADQLIEVTDVTIEPAETGARAGRGEEDG